MSETLQQRSFVSSATEFGPVPPMASMTIEPSLFLALSPFKDFLKPLNLGHFESSVCSCTKTDVGIRSPEVLLTLPHHSDSLFRAHSICFAFFVIPFPEFRLDVLSVIFSIEYPKRISRTSNHNRLILAWQIRACRLGGRSEYFLYACSHTKMY